MNPTPLSKLCLTYVIYRISSSYLYGFPVKLILSLTLYHIFLFIGTLGHCQAQSPVLLEEVLRSIFNKKHEKSKRAIYSAFTQFCSSHDHTDNKNSTEVIGQFLVERCNRLKGSAKTLSSVYGFIKEGLGREFKEGPNKNADNTIKKVIKQLEYRDRTSVKQSSPLRLKQMIKLFGGKVLSDQDLLFATVAIVGHCGMLRTANLTDGLKVDDVVWAKDRKSFSLTIHRSKTERKGGPRYLYFKRNGHSRVCPVILMLKWFDRFNLWDCSEFKVFPSVKRYGFDFRKSISGDWIRKNIKRSVALLGLNPAEFSGHSLRSGGATDLFAAGVPFYAIKKRGHWSSDAALLYYRDSLSADFMVFKAFTRLVNECV